MSESTTAELPILLQERIQFLADALHAQNPGFVTALKDIHKMTQENAEYVYAMTDEQFRTIVDGYKRYTKIEIDVKKVSARKMDKAAIAAMDEDSV